VRLDDVLIPVGVRHGLGFDADPAAAEHIVGAQAARGHFIGPAPVA
jgi:hypothetical protein